MLMCNSIIDPTCVEAGVLGDAKCHGRGTSGRGGRRRGHGDGRRLLAGRAALAARLHGHGCHAVRVVALERVVVARLFWRAGLALAAAAVAAAAQAAAEVAASQDAAHDEKRLAPGARHYEIRINILLAKLLRDVQSQRSIVVINVSLRSVAKYRMCAINFFELLRRVWIIRIFIRMVLQRQLSVTFLDIVCCCSLRYLKYLIETVSGC